MIEHLNKARNENNNPASLTYFYCVRNSIESERVDSDEIMRSILKQLFFFTFVIFVKELIATKYKELKKKIIKNKCEDFSKLTISKCEKLILKFLINNSIIIVIDVLNECNSI